MYHYGLSNIIFISHLNSSIILRAKIAVLQTEPIRPAADTTRWSLRSERSAVVMMSGAMGAGFDESA
ncbi:unnamed protein product [Nippostrongylus brasiliensis]|uniref:Uncharacterized protein n=1 Tax=Nippostrongylus brasiliensis TaxID=27835 RepID=A0A0N4YEK4_NIPBR|nr:unnamed protein product [Nippostrongylus brasiliensis]